MKTKAILTCLLSLFVLQIADSQNQRRQRGGPDGIVRPRISETLPVNVYADNWFKLYINGKLIAVDSIEFMPHNVVSVQILPDYPMTIAVMAKDNANAITALEYNDSNIGDGGLILKIGSDIVSDGTWKAKNFFHGPINGDLRNPKIKMTPIPEKWFAVDFDDSDWEQATEHSEEAVRPKEPFYDTDFEGAKFIWTSDLKLDNTILFRKRVEKPGWKPRWNLGER